MPHMEQNKFVLVREKTKKHPKKNQVGRGGGGSGSEASYQLFYLPVHKNLTPAPMSFF